MFTVTCTWSEKQKQKRNRNCVEIVAIFRKIGMSVLKKRNNNKRNLDRNLIG